MSSYRVLALKWRPQRFGDVAGQAHISKTLANALETGRAAHAYLFTGPRGVGKTTMARVLAKAFNCEEGLSAEPCGHCSACVEITQGSALDVIEIDGASNRGIDDIRELREGVRYAPARLRRKVYIIDEVHMLTSEAFNALLKTLEEPPDHVVFVLATTEVLKVPQTILSRCQRFDFARLRSAEAVARLSHICENEQIAADHDALQLIAVKGEGSMRDALTLLDQVAATGERPITSEVVRRALGIAGRELYFTWTRAIHEGRTADLLASLGRAVDDGANLVELAEEFLLHLRNLLLVATEPALASQIECTEDERALYLGDGAAFEAADLLRFCRMIMEAVVQMRRSSFPRVHLEVALAEMSVLPKSIDLRRFVDAVRQRVPEDPVPASETGGDALPKGDSASPADSGRRVKPSTASVVRVRDDDGEDHTANNGFLADTPAPPAIEVTPTVPVSSVPVAAENVRSDSAVPSDSARNDAVPSDATVPSDSVQNASVPSDSIRSDSVGSDSVPSVDVPLGAERKLADSSHAIVPNAASFRNAVEPRSEDEDRPVPDGRSEAIERAMDVRAGAEFGREQNSGMDPVPNTESSADSGGEQDPWTNALAEIAAVKPPLQGFLYGARAVLDPDDVLRISIPARAKIYLDLLQARDNRRIVVEAVRRAYGRPLGLRFEANAPAATEPAPIKNTEKGSAKGSSGIQRIVELFDGDVLGSA